MRHRLTVQALAIALGMAIPSLAAAAAGVQYTPDLIETLVNKDVNNQRWAIARDNTTGIVTGNVFSLAGGPPQYVWCEQKSIIEGDVTLQCYGADACPLAPCPVTEWTIISPPVVLPTKLKEASRDLAWTLLVPRRARRRKYLCEVRFARNPSGNFHQRGSGTSPEL